MPCFTKTPEAKNLWIREGGVSRLSIENFLSHSAENFLLEPFSVSLITGTEKVWIRRGEHQDLPSKTFCLRVPKIFVGQSFSVAIISGIEKVWIRRGGIKIFRRKFFVSQCRKIP